MPIDPSNLPLNLAAAEQSQLGQILDRLQGRALDQAAAVQSQDQGKREASEQVQETREVEPGAVPAGGARPRPAPARGDPPRGERPGGPRPPEEPPPPDPHGRGRRIDRCL